MSMIHIPGRNKGRIILYALSTCIWCRKTQELLDQMGVEYDYVHLDALEGDEKTKATEEVKALNPRCSFPTLAINDTCIVGYHEDKVREALQE
jgi:glutaredoxin-like protein NrdH